MTCQHGYTVNWDCPFCPSILDDTRPEGDVAPSEYQDLYNDKWVQDIINREAEEQ